MQEVTSLCHLIMVWPQKPKKNENNKHTRPYMQVREATQPYAETRDPPSQDPRDHIAQPARHERIIHSHYCTLNRFSTVAGPLAGVSDNCWVLAIVNLFLMHAFGDTVEQYRYVWCKSLCGCFFGLLPLSLFCFAIFWMATRRSGWGCACRRFFVFVFFHVD